MTQSEQNIPEAIDQIAKLLTDLELAFRGGEPGKSSSVVYTIVPSDNNNEYEIGTHNPALFVSLDWLEAQTLEKTLNLSGIVSSRGHYHFLVRPETLAEIKPVIDAKIIALAEETALQKKEELKNEIKAAFQKAWLFTPEKAKSMGLKEDLGERTPNDLIIEASIANIWLNPDVAVDFPEASSFFNDVAKTLDMADSQSVLTEEERQTLIQETGKQFIATRKLQNTLDELGDDIHIVPRALTFSR